MRLWLGRFPEIGVIEDAPRHPWRGAHLDVSRHFWPEGDVLRFLDILAWMKLNRFHWHLTGDEGWRVQIKALPELTTIGDWRGADLPLVRICEAAGHFRKPVFKSDLAR